MTDPATTADLDRILSSASVPAMPAGLIDRIVAEAQRPGRAALPALAPRRPRARQWTRRGVWSGIVAMNLVLATAVAAAFGGGAPIFARIATAARHVVEHIRHPFHHHAQAQAPVRPRAVHMMAVPPSAIRTTAADGVPAAMPHRLAAAPLTIPPTPTVPHLTSHFPAVAVPVHLDRPPMAGRLASPVPKHDTLWPPVHRSPHPAAQPPIERGTANVSADTPRMQERSPRTPVASPAVPHAEKALGTAADIPQPGMDDGVVRGERRQRTETPKRQAPAGLRDDDWMWRPNWRQRLMQQKQQLPQQSKQQQPEQEQTVGMTPNAPSKAKANRHSNQPDWRRRFGIGARPHINPPRPPGGRRQRS